MIPSAEAIAQRRITKHFIATDQEMILPVPHEKTPNGSGGFTLTPLPARTQQAGRLIPLTNPATERETLDGKLVVVEFILVMNYEAVIAKGDTFYARGRKHEVVHVQEKTDYQVKAELITRG